MDVQHVVAQIGNSRCVERSCATCADISEETRLELARLVRIRTFRAGETGLAESEELPLRWRGRVRLAGHAEDAASRRQEDQGYEHHPRQRHAAVPGALTDVS